jgi:exonuclease III
MEPTAAPEDDGSVFSAQQRQRTSRIRVAAATPASTGRNVRARSAVIHQRSNNTKPQIRIATFNIRSGRGERLIAALRALEQLNVDVGLLTEVKLTDERYTRHSFGYEVAATTAVHHSQGGVALCWRDTEVSQVEGVHRHGPNVISCELVTGGRRWLVIGAYIPPSEVDGSTCQHILAAQSRRPRLPVIVLGDLNVDLCQVELGSLRDAGIAAAVATLGVEDMLKNFCQTRHHGDGYTWRMRRDGQMVTGRCDYILADDRRYFQSVQIKTPRHYDSDHDAVVAVMLPRPPIEHRRYLEGQKAFPLHVEERDFNDADRLLRQLHRVHRTEGEAQPGRPEWVSAETWRLVDQRALGRRTGVLAGRQLRIINSAIRRSMRRDRKRRTEAAGGCHPGSVRGR